MKKQLVIFIYLIIALPFNIFAKISIDNVFIFNSNRYDEIKFGDKLIKDNTISLNKIDKIMRTNEESYNQWNSFQTYYLPSVFFSSLVAPAFFGVIGSNVVNDRESTPEELFFTACAIIPPIVLSLNFLEPMFFDCLTKFNQNVSINYQSTNLFEKSSKKFLRDHLILNNEITAKTLMVGFIYAFSEKPSLFGWLSFIGGGLQISNSKDAALIGGFSLYNLLLANGKPKEEVFFTNLVIYGITELFISNDTRKDSYTKNYYKLNNPSIKINPYLYEDKVGLVLSTEF